MYYATKGNSKEDDALFWQSVLTRANDFINSKETGSGDIFRITQVEDLATIETDVESFISKNSEKYGKKKSLVFGHMLA